MSEIKAKEYLLNAIYNLEKNVKDKPCELKDMFLEMAIEQAKSALKELTDEWQLELKSLGLKIG